MLHSPYNGSGQTSGVSALGRDRARARSVFLPRSPESGRSSFDLSHTSAPVFEDLDPAFGNPFSKLVRNVVTGDLSSRIAGGREQGFRASAPNHRMRGANLRCGGAADETFFGDELALVDESYCRFDETGVTGCRGVLRRGGSCARTENEKDDRGHRCPETGHRREDRLIQPWIPTPYHSHPRVCL